MVTIANFREENYEVVEGTRCIKVYIPDDDSFIHLLAGLLALAGSEGNYVQADADKAADLAQQWRNAYLQSDWNQCEAAVIPVGAIMQYGAGGVPDGWLLCDGNEVLKADYLDLWNTITTAWGTATLGDDYFVLPDFRNKSAYGYQSGGGATKTFGSTHGAETVTLTESQIPAHSHAAPVSGAASGSVGNTAVYSGGLFLEPRLNTQTTGGGESHNNLHPVAICGFIIYAGV